MQAAIASMRYTPLVLCPTLSVCAFFFFLVVDDNKNPEAGYFKGEDAYLVPGSGGSKSEAGSGLLS